MKRSTERILTTHTGSLPRTAKVVELLLAEQQKAGRAPRRTAAAVREAVATWCKSRSNAASTSSMTASRAAPTTPCTCSTG